MGVDVRWENDSPCAEDDADAQSPKGRQMSVLLRTDAKSRVNIPCIVLVGVFPNRTRIRNGKGTMQTGDDVDECTESHR